MDLSGLEAGLSAASRSMDNYFEIQRREREYQNIPIEIAAASTASEVCKRLKRIVNSFMASLNSEQEVGIQLVSFGATHQIAVECISAVGPNLLVFKGMEGNLPMTLVQHVSQLSFLLVPLPVSQPDAAPRRKIGFQVEPSDTALD